jgi:hypothetical protein
MLHVEVISFADFEGGFCQLLALLRTAQSLAERKPFMTGFPP